MRQREPAPQVVARARAAAGGALGRAAQEAVCAGLVADAALRAAALCPDAAYCERVVKVLALAAALCAGTPGAAPIHPAALDSPILLGDAPSAARSFISALLFEPVASQ